MNSDQKKALTQIGHSKHLDKFVNDPDTKVRQHVAQYGDDSYKDKLVKDKDLSLIHI